MKLILKIIVVLTLIEASLTQSYNYSEAIDKSVIFFENTLEKHLIPGIVAGVSINGTQVWVQPFGLTDIENEVKTRVDSVWRLASISKSLTSALIGKLIDEGRVGLDKSIHEYLSPSVFPVKQWNRKNVTITVGQVMSHTAGLHVMDERGDLLIKLSYQNVTDTLAPFKDLPLIHAPGAAYNYSNYNFQVIGAIIESVLNQTYESVVNKMFKDLEMNSTFCERRERIIPHRSRYYQTVQSSDGKWVLANCPLFDDLVSLESYWPAGGIVSILPDLLRFGSHINKWSKGLNTTKTFNLSAKAVAQLWQPIADVNKAFGNAFKTPEKFKYAHAWFITELDKPIICPRCKFSNIKEIKWHSGSMNGLNTLLMVEPLNDVVAAVFLNHLAAPDFFFKLNEMGETLLRNFMN